MSFINHKNESTKQKSRSMHDWISCCSWSPMEASLRSVEWAVRLTKGLEQICIRAAPHQWLLAWPWEMLAQGFPKVSFNKTKGSNIIAH